MRRCGSFEEKVPAFRAARDYSRPTVRMSRENCIAVVDLAGVREADAIPVDRYFFVLAGSRDD